MQPPLVVTYHLETSQSKRLEAPKEGWPVKKKFVKHLTTTPPNMDITTEPLWLFTNSKDLGIQERNGGKCSWMLWKKGSTPCLLHVAVYEPWTVLLLHSLYFIEPCPIEGGIMGLRLCLRVPSGSSPKKKKQYRWNLIWKTIFELQLEWVFMEPKCCQTNLKGKCYV